MPIVDLTRGCSKKFEWIHRRHRPAEKGAVGKYGAGTPREALVGRLGSITRIGGASQRLAFPSTLDTAAGLHNTAFWAAMRPHLRQTKRNSGI